MVDENDGDEGDDGDDGDDDETNWTSDINSFPIDRFRIKNEILVLPNLLQKSVEQQRINPWKWIPANDIEPMDWSKQSERNVRRTNGE